MVKPGLGIRLRGKMVHTHFPGSESDYHNDFILDLGVFNVVSYLPSTSAVYSLEQ